MRIIFFLTFFVFLFCLTHNNSLAEDITTHKAQRISFTKTSNNNKNDQEDTKRKIFLKKKKGQKIEQNIKSSKSTEDINPKQNDQSEISNEQINKNDNKQEDSEENSDQKYHDYYNHIDDKKINIYIHAGIGTTGIYIDASSYYLNLIGIRAEYSFLPYWNLNFLDSLLNQVDNDVYYHASTEIKPSFGAYLSLRPLTLLSKHLSGFRMDIGFRYLKGYVKASGTQEQDFIGMLDNLISGINTSARFRYEQQRRQGEEVEENFISSRAVKSMALNFFARHGVPEDTFAGAGTLEIPIYFSNGIRPYFGIGWDINLFKGFDLSISLGLLLSTWRIENVQLFYKDKQLSYYRDLIEQHFEDLNISNGYLASWFLEQFDKLTNKPINGNVNMVKRVLEQLGWISKIWPVVQIGFGWQFDL